jgi:hypothetical protein
MGLETSSRVGESSGGLSRLVTLRGAGGRFRGMVVVKVDVRDHVTVPQVEFQKDSTAASFKLWVCLF